MATIGTGVDINKFTIWNVNESRKASLEEIEHLIDTKQLFINYWVHGDNIGDVFPDIQCANIDEFVIKKVSK